MNKKSSRVKDKNENKMKNGEKMRKNFVFIFMFSVVFAVSFLTIDTINRNFFNEETTTQILSDATEKHNYRYRISVFNGKLAVFDRDSKLPYKVYDTYISTLPEEDRRIIEAGIFTDSSTEMMKIIEEYTS